MSTTGLKVSILVLQLAELFGNDQKCGLVGGDVSPVVGFGVIKVKAISS